jgi:transcription elongation factor Elf1
MDSGNPERRQRAQPVAVERRQSTEKWTCTQCGGLKWRIVNTRFIHDVQYRERDCVQCGARFDNGAGERLGRMIRGPVQKTA